MNPCISPGKIVCEVSTASPECTADWTSAKPTTNDKDLNTKHHDHAPSTNRGGRKRSATYKDYPMRTRDHTNYHTGNNQGQNYTGGKARIIPTHPKPSYSNVAMILSPTTQIAQPPSISSASDMNTAQDQYHTTNSEQNQSQYHNIQDSDMTGSLASCRPRGRYTLTVYGLPYREGQEALNHQWWNSRMATRRDSQRRSHNLCGLSYREGKVACYQYRRPESAK